MLKSTIISVVFLAIFIGNAFVWQNPSFGLLLLIFYAFYFSARLGKGSIPNESPLFQWAFGFWLLLSLIMLAGSAAYYIAELTATVSQVIVLLSVPVALWVSKRVKPSKIKSWIHDRLRSAVHNIPSGVWLAAAFILVALVMALTMLVSSSTTEPIRSIWLVVPSAIFFIFVIASMLLSALFLRGRERTLTVLLTIAVLFILFSAASFVFPIGYGFDSFIHSTTQSYIAEFGTISPKPFYYIGQYALVLFLHQAFLIPIAVANTWVLPALAAMLIPIFWLSAALHLVPDRRAAAATLFGIFLIPLSFFIVTTPQGLANLWTLIGVLAAVPYLLNAERPRVFWLAIPALAALATHPIAGIPLVLFVLLIASNPNRAKGSLRVVARVLFWLIAILGSVVLPASFLINSVISGNPLVFDLSSITTSAIGQTLNLSVFLENRFEPILDFVYLYGFNALILLLLLAIFGWIKFRKQIPRSLYIPIIMAVMLFVNFLILSIALEFTFLIDYERQNFAQRLVPLALFMLVPFLILGLAPIAKRIKESPISIRAFSIGLMAAIMASSFYLAYPRHDSFAISRGFNVSEHDLRAVQFIEEVADGVPYVVLANQSVSAAAIKELGFSRYYGDFFFYPIPTGGDLYEFFLKMNDQPSRELATQALDLMNNRCRQNPKCQIPNARSLYFVVNDYWWQAPIIVENAKTTADEWFDISGGKIHIFRYDF